MDLEDTRELLSSLLVDLIPDDWVNDIWTREFVDLPPLPNDLKARLTTNNELPDNLVKLHDVLLTWAKGSHAATQTFWMVLSDSGMSVQYLVVLIHHLMELAKMRSSCVGQWLMGGVAAGVYFLLLRIPGNQDTKNKRGNRNQGKQAKRQKKHTVVVEMEISSFDDDAAEDEMEDFRPSARESERLRLSCVGLLKDFINLLEVTPQFDSNDLSSRVISCLVDLSHLETAGFNDGFENQASIENLDNIAQLAFCGLQVVCRSKKLNVISNVLKLLMPNVMLQKMDSPTALASNAVSTSSLSVRDHSVDFVCWLMKDVGVDDLVERVRVFIQHICIRVPDRTDLRAKVAEAVVAIMKTIPTREYAEMVKWIRKYSKNLKIHHRIFGLDIISLLLDEPERSNDGVDDHSLHCYLSRQSLVEFIIDRCSDIAPSVRTRAILAFDHCATSDNLVLNMIIRGIVTPRLADRPAAPRLLVKTPAGYRNANQQSGGCDIADETTVQSEVQSDIAAQLASVALTSSDEISSVKNSSDIPVSSSMPSSHLDLALLDNAGVTSMLRRRSADDKINVRKAALQVLEKIVKLEGENFTPMNIEILRDRCRDSAVSVRKQALQSLTDVLYAFPQHHIVKKAWLTGVLPLVLDVESGVMSKCMDIISSTIFDNIVSHAKSVTDGHRLAWSLLALIADAKCVDLSRYFQKACNHLSKTGGCMSTLIANLKTHVDTENNAGAWLLLSELVSSAPKRDMDFVCNYWRQHARETSASSSLTNVRVLSTFAKVAATVSITVQSAFVEDLKQMIKNFETAPDITAAIVHVLYTISESNNSSLDDWFGGVLMACNEYLSKVILTDSDSEFDEELTARHLFALGEISQFYPKQTPSRAFMLVQSIIAAPTITSIDGSSQRSQTQSSQSVPISQFRGSTMSARIRAFAFITLGKLCLQNENISKTCVPALARELEISENASIRNNVVVIMCDLCKRYTSLIDCYVPCIAACLRDSSSLIRRQTLTLLTNLLQEDYLKWKGSLLFRFLSSTVDEDPEIRQFATFCLSQLLVQRSPGLFFSHFVESLFYFNSYEGHSVYNKFNETDRDKKLFSLQESANTDKRMRIYKFMLEHMVDEQRFQITGKLIQEVLVSIVDEVLSLDASASAILQDTLACLSCKEIKMAALRPKPADDFAENDQDVANAVINAAKKTFITQVTKKAFVETTVPVLIALKHKLEKHRSPVLRDFMVCLRELMKDYKTEIKDVLATDKQLANELEFDLRKFEEDQLPKRGESSPQAMTVAVLQATPTVTQPKKTDVMRLQSSRNQADSPTLQGRRVSLATIAVINTARKVMEKAKLNDSIRSLPGTPTGPQQMDIAMRHPDAQAKRRFTSAHLRAISTPAVNLRNCDITFSADNVSVIQSPALRVKS